MDFHTEVVLRFAASMICLFLVVASRWAKPASPEWRVKFCAIAAAGLALVTFYNFGFVRHYRGEGFVNYHEHFHYYLGGKYFPELGYDGLYAASIAAERETQSQTDLPRTVRDLRTNRVVPTASRRVVSQHPDLATQNS